MQFSTFIHLIIFIAYQINHEFYIFYTNDPRHSWPWQSGYGKTSGMTDTVVENSIDPSFSLDISFTAV